MDDRRYPIEDVASRRTARWPLRIREAVVTTALTLCALFSISVTVITIGVLSVESSKFFGLLDWRQSQAGSGAEVTNASVPPDTRPDAPPVIAPPPGGGPSPNEALPSETASVRRTGSQVDHVSPSAFFFGTRWEPTNGHYGVLPLLFGTAMVTVIAMLVAVPTGLILAIWLSEYAPRLAREIIKPILEILAGIPTVVFGFFAIQFVTPGLREILGDTVEIHNALSAGLMVGLLCVPIVCSLSEDALSAVRRELREAALGLGATKLETTLQVVVPAALSGIISAVLLAIARAVGETMVVTLAAGATARLTLDPRTSINTMTGYVAQRVGGDVSRVEFGYYSIYAVALTLFLIVFAITILGSLIRRRYREV